MQQIKGDWWPERDHVCKNVAYNFDGADKAYRACKKFDLVIQAGGCVGTWPRYLKKTFSEVHTFEPSPENFELLINNIGKIPGIIKHHAALSDKDGECGLKLNPKNCGDDQTVPGEGTRTVRIDSLGLNPDLIYLDIQGDEYLALMGAEQTLIRCSPVIGIEVDNKLSRLKGDAVKLLEDLGYVQFKQVKQDHLFWRT